MCHLACVGVLSLRSNLKFNVIFKAPQHKRFEHQVQAAQLMFVYFTLISQRVRFNILGEPFLELLMTIEELRHNKMK